MSTVKFAKAVVLMGLMVVAVGVVLGLSIGAALAGPEGEASPEKGVRPLLPAGPEGASDKRGQTPFSPAHLQKMEELRVEGNRWFAMALAAVIGLSCLAAGYAVGKVGSAAMGAASERPEIVGRALLFVALAEGIAIYGVLAAILLYTKIG